MAAAGFQRRQRLCSGAQFDRVFADSVRSADRHFTILGRHNSEGNARLGLVVGKRVDKRAVGRNRLKRIVRESFRLRCSTEAASNQLAPYDLVVIAKPPAASADSALLRQTLERLLSRFKHDPTT